jgi:hypothetical protein
MCAIGENSTLLVVTNIALGIVCALFWLWVLVAIVREAIGRWRTRASLPKGWPPDEKPREPVIPDFWPPTVKR